MTALHSAPSPAPARSAAAAIAAARAEGAAARAEGAERAKDAETTKGAGRAASARRSESAGPSESAGRSESTEPGGRRLTAGLVRWHMGLGELGLRLFLLHLLWIAGTLAGLVVAGLFPATAAVHAVLREDLREAARERAGEDTPPRPGLWRAFWSAWRAELGRANRIGAVLVLGWAVIALDRWILTGAVVGGSSTAADGGGALDLGAAAPWISGVVVALTIVTALLSIVVWPLAAHFDDPLPRIWRMTLSLLVTRLPLTLSIAAVLMASVWVWQSIPGLVPVFGLALPFWAVSMLIWRSGVLPRT